MLSYRVEFIVRRVFLNLFTKINTPPDNLTNNILAFNLAKYSVYFYIFYYIYKRNNKIINSTNFSFFCNFLFNSLLCWFGPVGV